MSEEEFPCVMDCGVSLRLMVVEFVATMEWLLMLQSKETVVVFEFVHAVRVGRRTFVGDRVAVPPEWETVGEFLNDFDRV